jgi:pimeloyl-ACP methyl ester carboxylesterase
VSDRGGSRAARHLPFGDGNVLAYAEYGEADGYPILVQHGLIASIGDYHLFDRLIASGKRLVCAARPGYGESSPYGMKNIGEWGEIVSALVDELRLTSFDVLGMSSGAPYSYSIGHALPDKVRSIFIFSGTPALYDDRVLAHWPYESNRGASMAELENLAHGLFFANLSREDASRIDVKDSMMHHCFGIAQDLKLRCVDWGFDLSDLRPAVHMQHGVADAEVPIIAAEMTSRLLPNCRFEARKEGGHFSNELLDRFIEDTMLKSGSA